MQNVNIPEGYQQITPYLIVPGAIKFIDFMKTVFAAELVDNLHMRDKTTVQHGEIRVGKSVIMFADSTENYPPQTAGMFIYVNDCDIVFKKALDEGATQVMPPSDMPYGRSAGVKDPAGNIWWLTSVQPLPGRI